MSRTNTMGRNANGNGSIRKISTTRNGKTYTYWQARYTAGYDMGTGKQIQRSITGKTQKEVAQKLKQITLDIDNGTYHEPCKMTIGEWLDIWVKDFLVSVKPRTADSYKAVVKNHLKPAFAAGKLNEVKTLDVQRFYNSLQTKKDGRPALSAKSIRNIHGVFHKAMQQAVDLGYLATNSVNSCKLPRVQRKEICPLGSDAIARSLTVIKGHRFETVYLVTLFTGMREGEILGLTWDCIDFSKNTITVNKQLQKERKGQGVYHLVSTKNGKSRCLTVAPFVIETLKLQKTRQAAWKIAAGSAWEENLLVFTNEFGHNLSAQTVYLHFKTLAEKAGCPDARFHDLRHSYAVASLQSGDDIKTLQENLGHHTAAFTLDVYGHVTAKMKQDSADHMQKFIESLS